MQHLTIKNFSNSEELRDYFEKYGRGDNFTLDQFDIMFDHLNECGPDLEIDVIGLCCDFSGYESIEDAAKDLGYEDVDTMESEFGILTGRNGCVLIMH